MDGLIQSREILLLSLLAFCQRSASTQEKLWTGLTRKESKCVKSFNEWRKDYIYVTLRIWIKSMFPFLNITLSRLQVQALLWNDIVKDSLTQSWFCSPTWCLRPVLGFPDWDVYFSGHTALFTVGLLSHKSVLHISLFFPYNAYLSIVYTSNYLKRSPVPSRFLLTLYYMLLTYLSGCDYLHVCYSMHTGSWATTHPSALY